MIRWIVADNSKHTLSPFGMPDNVIVVQGVESDMTIPESVRGSYQHGDAINISVNSVTTRWVLILDADFFVVRDQWVFDITSNAAENEIAFFGSPWHPRWFNKFRGFPCVHCLLIDLDQVNLEELDFRPDLPVHLASPDDDSSGGAPTNDPSYPATIIRNLTELVFLRDRRVIGSSHDTGYRLYESFGKDRRLTAECLQPVYRPDLQFEGPRHARGGLNRALERVLPERLCYFPKRVDASTEKGFRDLGAYDAFGHGWEEFLWQGLPFGFHIRGFQNRDDDAQTLNHIRQALSFFTLDSD